MPVRFRGLLASVIGRVTFSRQWSPLKRWFLIPDVLSSEMSVAHGFSASERTLFFNRAFNQHFDKLFLHKTACRLPYQDCARLKSNGIGSMLGFLIQ